MNDIVSNCQLCEEHSLHVIGQDNLKLMQCVNCGYTSTDKFLGNVEDNEEYKKLSEDMKNWAVEKNGRIWIPTMMTLPIGMLYPFNEDPENEIDKNMRWGYAEMIDIPEEEQKDYPVPNQEGMFYKKTYDVDNAKVYDTFFKAMLEINEEMKKQQTLQPTELKLPKLKKIDG
tara:strand:- start:1884 stop:2399 length:516 start_codon:yes stop_codon:yes gene_type:complete